MVQRNDFSIRTMESVDLAPLVEMLNLASLSTVGGRSAVIAESGKLRRTDGVPPSAAQVVAVNSRGQLIGYQYLSSSAPYVIQETGGSIHPDFDSLALRVALLDWAEAKASANIPSAPDFARLLLYWNIYEQDRTALDFLLANGFSFARQWIHMAVEMETAPAKPLMAGGITIKPLDPARDWSKVDPALDEAFADHWGHVDEAALLSPTERKAAPEPESASEPEPIDDDPYWNSSGLCFVAWDGDTVVGSCLCNARTVEDEDSGKLGSLSVRRQYRGRGIGKALALTALNEFYRRGTRRVITDTDGESFSLSYRLYESVGMKIFRRQNLYEKELRRGKELRLLDAHR